MKTPVSESLFNKVLINLNDCLYMKTNYINQNHLVKDFSKLLSGTQNKLPSHRNQSRRRNQMTGFYMKTLAFKESRLHKHY